MLINEGFFSKYVLMRPFTGFVFHCNTKMIEKGYKDDNKNPNLQVGTWLCFSSEQPLL